MLSAPVSQGKDDVCAYEGDSPQVGMCLFLAEAAPRECTRETVLEFSQVAWTTPPYSRLANKRRCSFGDGISFPKEGSAA